MDLASAEAEIRHVFGDTPITEASIGAAPPDILVKLSDAKQPHLTGLNEDEYRLISLKNLNSLLSEFRGCEEGI